MSGKDTSTLLADMQAQLLTLRDLTSFATEEQNAYLSQTAGMIDQVIRDYDKKTD